MNVLSPGRTAFIGVGFADRSDSFDLNVALQDHFKWVLKENQIEKEKSEPTQKLDLGFKEGQTIKINMKITVGRLAKLGVKVRRRMPKLVDGRWMLYYHLYFHYGISIN